MAKNKDIKFIVSNTTEAGITYAEGCNFSDEPPASFPAKVCQFLYKRYEAFSASHDAGIVFIPCELIDCNGDALKRIVLQYADEWKLDKKFIDWVNESCTFCNSLVDRIVTGFPDEDADEIFKELGYEDKLLDAAEIFYLWVIESKKNIDELKKIFPLQAAGLNVVWTDDLSFYRTRKVCILNGAHTMFVPAGFLYGFDTVRECIEDSTMLKFIRKGIFEEIIPVMDGDKKMLQEYAEDVLERFANPFIKHLLINIALNSTSKFKVRDLPSLLGYIEKFGKAPKILSFIMAALITFYKGNERDGRILKSAHLHNGEHYNISDNEEAVTFFEKLYSETDEPYELAERVLANENFWGADLTKYNCLVELVSDCILSIQKNGMKKAVALVVED